MADALVSVERLTKTYGRARGVVDCSFDVQPGEVFGFLARTAPARRRHPAASRLIRPTAGRVVAGDRETVAARRRGAGAHRVPVRRPAPVRAPHPREHLRYLASLRGLPGLGDGESIAGRLELELDRPVRALSKGNRQKVGIVLALFHRPELLVLDEPTCGSTR